MAFRKIFFTTGFMIFPATFALFYWVRVSAIGNEIQRLIPGFIIFSALVALVILEQVFRYKNAVSQKPVALRDLLLTLVNVLFTGTLMRVIFVPFVLFFPEIFFGRSLFFSPAVQLGPFWLQFFLVILLYSFLRYGIHRIQHTVPFLWELHSYHHTVTDLKASNTFVSHPIDYSLRSILPAAILSVVGFDPAAILFGAGLLITASTLAHCGAGLHAGWLNYIFVTPEIHRWHHSAIVPEGHKFSVNYGLGFILWDRLFGTYYLPMKDGIPEQPEKIGHPGGYADEGNFLKIFFLTRCLPDFMRPSQQ